MKSPCSLGSRSIYTGLALLLLSRTLVSTENASQHKSNQIQNSPEPVPLSNDFDWKLVKEVFRHEQQNAIFSPFSIKLLLTLLLEASADNSTTKRELSTALAGSNVEKDRQLYREFLESSTKENSDYQFNIGTRVFVDQSIANVTVSYAQLMETCYKTVIEPVKFSDSHVTAAKVNDWCAKITQGHLTDLVEEDHIKDSAMIIANVLFLKASWRNSFQEQHNSRQPFQISEKASVEAEFMNQTDIYEYHDDPELQVELLRLPYKGRHFSMVMILPYLNKSLEDVVGTLTSENLIQLESKLQREEIVVVIPKFKFDYGTTLNDILIALGISEVFSSQAALPQLSGGTNSTLQVSRILQKAGIEVNEKGTLAFAATEIQLVNKFGIDDSPIKFEANRPFLFYIKDEDSDVLLFVGKVLNPAAAPGRI